MRCKKEEGAKGRVMDLGYVVWFDAWEIRDEGKFWKSIRLSLFVDHKNELKKLK